MLLTIVDHWAVTAMSLNTRDMRLMERLARAQVRKVGGANEGAVDQDGGDPACCLNGMVAEKLRAAFFDELPVERADRTLVAFPALDGRCYGLRIAANFYTFSFECLSPSCRCLSRPSLQESYQFLEIANGICKDGRVTCYQRAAKSPAWLARSVDKVGFTGHTPKMSFGLFGTVATR